MNSKEYSAVSIDYINSTSLEHRKKHGQYFTPNSVREVLFAQLPKLQCPTILDPAVGSGEFLISAKWYYPYAKLEGWELDPRLSDICANTLPHADIKCVDSLSHKTSKKYDLIIGNPPYFQFKPDDELKKDYGEIICGRSNIFGFFIYKSLKLLKDGGYLAFVVPPSMNNGAYFARLREFIASDYEIEFLKILNDPGLFTDALQAVMIIVIRKAKGTGKYIFKKDGITIFTENYEYLRDFYKDKTTLRDLGWAVKTGSIVWNNNKQALTDSAEGNTLLIWAHNIKKGQLEINNNPSKPQYISGQKKIVGPAIVTNRIIGHPNKAKLNAAFVEPGVEFLAENHVNVITPAPSHADYIGDVVKQLNASDNTAVLFSITGNTQISKTELEKLYPLEISRLQ